MRGLQGHSKPGHHPCIPGRWSKLFKAGSCPCVLAAAFGRGFKEICHCEYLQRVIPIQPPTLRVNVAQVPLVVVFVVFQPQRSSHYCLKYKEGATLNSVRGLHSLQRLQCGFPVEGSGTYFPFWLDVVEVLVSAALVQFLHIHKGNIHMEGMLASSSHPSAA